MLKQNHEKNNRLVSDSSIVTNQPSEAAPESNFSTKTTFDTSDTKFTRLYKRLGLQYKHQSVSEQHLSEWVASGVREDLIHANVHSLTDADMIAECLNICAKNLKDSDRSILAGGWVCAGYQGVQFKADTPRFDKKKNKEIKYESVRNLQNNRYSLLIIPETLFADICNKYGVDPATKPKAEDPWTFILRHPEIPIGVVEGVKKAGCWMSNLLMPAVALHGHTMLNIFEKTESAISAFYHPKRQVFLCLDNDPAYSAKKAVDLTMTRFKENLALVRPSVIITAKNETQLEREVVKIAEKHNLSIDSLTVKLQKQRKTKYNVTLPEPVRVSFVELPEETKGCDDLWVLQGKEGLEKVLSKAKPIKRFIEHYRHCLGYKPNVEFSSTKWKVSIPGNEPFVVLIGAKGSGKTYAMRQVMIKAKAANDAIVYLSPRRSLNRQTAESMGLTFVEAQEVITANQIALCPQSLHKVPIDKLKNCVFMWDETTQCIQELVLSSTTNKNREVLLVNLVTLLTNAKQIICADADFKYHDINLLKGLVGVEPYLMRNKLAANKYKAYVTKGIQIANGVNAAGDLMNLADQFLSDGKRIAIYTGSQGEEYKFSSTSLGEYFWRFSPCVIDSRTIRDPDNQSYECMKKMNDFYALARQANPLIYTQTLGTGFSIDEPKLYDAVFGIFSGVGTPDAARQAIMRYRELVPRYLWIAERGKNDDLGGLGTYPHQVKTSLNRKLQYLKKIICKIDSQLIEENSEIKVNELLDNYVNEIIANNNYYNAHYFEAAIQGLEKDGAEIIDITEKLAKDTNGYRTYDELRDIAEINYAGVKEEIVEADVLSDEEFDELSRSNTIRKNDRFNLDKTALVKKYGVEVTDELIERDKNGWYKEIKNHYSASVGYEVIKARAQINYLRGTQRNFGELFDYTRKQNNLIIADLIRDSGLLEKLLENPIVDKESENQFSTKSPLDTTVDKEQADTEEIKLSHQLTINKEDEYSQKLYQFLVLNIQKMKDCFGLKIRKQSFDAKKFDFRLIKYLVVQLGFITAEEGASNNRKYTIGIPDDGRNKTFEYWLEKEQSYIENQNTWKREKEIQKLKEQLKPTISTSEFQESQKSEYFNHAWELIPVYERTLILNRVHNVKIPELNAILLTPDDEKFDEYLADIETWDKMTLDIETYGLDKKNKEGLHYRKGRIRLITISNGIRTYIADLGHRNIPNQAINWKTQKPALTPFFESLNRKLSDPTVKIIGHNIHFDLRFVRFNEFDAATNIQDTMLGIKIFFGDYGSTKGAKTNEVKTKSNPTEKKSSTVLSGGYALGNVEIKLLGLHRSKEEQKSDWGREDLTDEQIMYAAKDAHNTFYVYNAIEEWYADPVKYGFGKLAQEGLRDSWQLENDVISAAIEMEIAGVPVDREAATKLLTEYKELQTSLLNEWKMLVPEINYTQPKLKEYLETKYNLHLPKLDKEALAEMPDLEEVKLLRKLRAVKTPIQQLEQFLLASEQTGRIQTVFKTLTGTGRFSSGDSKKFSDFPNLQSVSAKALPVLKTYNLPGVRTVVKQADNSYIFVNHEKVKKFFGDLHKPVVDEKIAKYNRQHCIELIEYLQSLPVQNNYIDFERLDEIKTIKHLHQCLTVTGRRGMGGVDLAGAHGRIAADVANDKTAINGNNDDSIDNHSKVGVTVAKALGREVTWEEIQKGAKTGDTELKLYRDTAKNTYYGWLNGAGAKRIQTQIKANSGEIVSLEACQAAIKGCETLYPQLVEFRKELMKYMTSEEALITIDGEVYAINKIQMVNNRILHRATIANEQVDLPYTQILAAIWSRTEATALKRAFVKIQDAIKQNPHWELKVTNYVHDEINFEFNIDFAEEVITTVRNIIGDEFQKCLKYVKDGREADWQNLLLNSWADK